MDQGTKLTKSCEDELITICSKKKIQNIEYQQIFEFDVFFSVHWTLFAFVKKYR